MINKKEINAKYFASSDSIVFELKKNNIKFLFFLYSGRGKLSINISDINTFDKSFIEILRLSKISFY